MNDTLLWVVITVQTIALFVIIYLFLRQRGGSDDRLERDVKDLNASILAMREGLTDKMGEGQKLMVDNIQRQFAQSTQLITDVTRNLAELKATNKQVVGVTDELRTLQNILQNPKQRGVLGEFHLQTLLENVLPPGQFKMQHRFKDGTAVDAVIYLKDGKMLPIDAKFPLENYNRLVSEKDPARREQLTAQFKKDLQGRIDETAKYIRPKDKTMEFAFMFIPSEAIYYDLLVNQIGAASVSARDLVEYAFRDKKVIIVSPTSFMAYLQTVLQGLRSLEIEEKAEQIQKAVLNLNRHIKAHANSMERMGKSLSTTVNHFNSSSRSLSMVDKDVVKIADTSPSIEPLLIDKPATEGDED